MNKKIGLDVDGVLSSLGLHFLDYLSLPLHAPTEWSDSRFKDNFHKVDKDERFWLTMPRLIHPSTIKFEIDCYVTARNISSEVTEKWLELNGFPKRLVITVGMGKSKLQALKDRGVTIFLDDHEDNFLELNEGGIKTYLMDASHNQHVKTDLRIKNMKEFSEKMNTRYILVGPGASGKDYFRNYLTSKGYINDISYTTRPPRKGEVDGVDYHFVTPKQFKEIDFKESVTFNGWNYGTERSSFENSQVFIMTPKGMSQLSKEEREKFTVIYFDIPEEVRRERLSKRSDEDKIERRLEADRLDFETFLDFDWLVVDPEFNCEEILENL